MTKRFFANFVEKRCREEVGGAVVEREAERWKSKQLAKVVGDLFKIRGATSGRVVAILARRLNGNLPLTADRLYVRVAKKIHCEGDLIGAWRKEIMT